MDKSSSKWSQEEDDILRKAVEKYGSEWKKIACQIPGRNNKACRKRWVYSLCPDIHHGRWCPSEDEALREAVARLGHSWGAIAKQMPGRSDDQCAKRWREKLDPDNLTTEFTPEEDRILIDGVRRLKNQWNAISTCLTGRPAIACRNRYRSLTRRDPSLLQINKEAVGAATTSVTPQQQTRARASTSSTVLSSPSPPDSTAMSASPSWFSSTSTRSSICGPATPASPALAFAAAVGREGNDKDIAAASFDALAPSTLHDLLLASCQPPAAATEISPQPTDWLPPPAPAPAPAPAVSTSTLDATSSTFAPIEFDDLHDLFGSNTGSPVQGQLQQPVEQSTAGADGVLDWQGLGFNFGESAQAGCHTVDTTNVGASTSTSASSGNAVVEKRSTVISNATHTTEAATLLSPFRFVLPSTSTCNGSSPDSERRNKRPRTSPSPPTSPRTTAKRIASPAPAGRVTPPPPSPSSEEAEADVETGGSLGGVPRGYVLSCPLPHCRFQETSLTALLSHQLTHVEEERAEAMSRETRHRKRGRPHKHLISPRGMDD